MKCVTRMTMRYYCICLRNFEFRNEKDIQKEILGSSQFLAKQKYGGNDLMTDLKRDNIGLSGELKYEYRMYEFKY